MLDGTVDGMGDGPELLDLAQVAVLFGVSKNSTYQMIKERVVMVEFGLSRGTQHISLHLWDWTLTLIRWIGWTRYSWNGVDWNGGCLVVRLGPMVLTYWRSGTNAVTRQWQHSKATRVN